MGKTYVKTSSTAIARRSNAAATAITANEPSVKAGRAGHGAREK